MKTIDLSKKWKFRILGENVYGITNEFMETNVPSSIYASLLELGLIPDPYYRDNELTALKLMENEFEYDKCFLITREYMEQGDVEVCFEGIDTLADVFLNGHFLGKTNNMHRSWSFDITEYAVVGENRLTVKLHSPTKYIKEENEKVYTGGVSEGMEGYPHLRKAHCMFGWDWGPRLPDAGIFRKVSLILDSKKRLEQVYITQQHETNRVKLIFEVETSYHMSDCYSEMNIYVDGPDGTRYLANEQREIIIEEPELWWPNGYGRQPLYIAHIELYDESHQMLDHWERRIGLRTVTMDTKEDEWGNTFAHQVNGIDIFAMGADYIPEDNLLTRINKERTRKLLQACVDANYNCIRIWGGGYYPDDYFYDLCDEMGLLVWQDFMFACASYELDDEFEENIRHEITENVRRIRHHACLALWCGNNEMESQVLDKAWKPSKKQTMDYIKLFEYIIPQIVKKEDPNTFYWPSSPSSGGNFDNPWDELRGDNHYWDVWHGNKPFTEFRKFYFRYLSEFGFQSFPCMKTIESFTEKEDRNIFSRVMEMHQRSAAANGKILNYIAATYLYPKDFEHLVYTSQLLQAEAIRYGVEHYRRNRGRCMGTIVWQLNDIWPVASWSSIDYYGRWKALHYIEKRIFAPIMISCNEVGELSERPFCIKEPAPIEKSATLNIANETMSEVNGTAIWALRNPRGEVLFSGEENVVVPALSSVWLEKIDVSEWDEFNVYFSYSFIVNGEEVSTGTCLFTAPKHFHFVDPDLKFERNGERITVSAKAYAKSVEIKGVDEDVLLSDNYFDLNGDAKTVKIISGNPVKLSVRSVYDISQH